MATIREYVFLLGMGMKIEKHLNSIVMLEDMLFNIHDLF